MRWFVRNIRTFALALVLAVAVWISAVTSANPDEVRTLNSIPLEVIGQDSSLVNTDDFPATVEVTLRAPRSVWEQLTAQENPVRATLDLSGIGSGRYTLDVQIQILARPVQLVLANPTTVTVFLESLVSRTLPIDPSLRGEPAIGYQAGDPIFDPKEITVSGPESIVKDAVRARVFVNLAGVRENIDQSIVVQIVDAKNNPVSDVSAAPESVHVTIPIAQQGGFRDVAVKVTVEGQVASGYRLENISVLPPVITVFSSDPALVSALPGVVDTEPLNIQDAQENIATRLGLILPANVRPVGSQTVQVTVGISAIQTSLTLMNQPINIIGLSEDLTAQVFPETVDVIISGPLPVLDALTPQDVIVNVDVTGFGPGTYQLTPNMVSLVSNVLVESILPGTVEVTLFVPETTPTPTPKP